MPLICIHFVLGGGLALMLTDPPYNVALGKRNNPKGAKRRLRQDDGLLILNDEFDDEDEFSLFLSTALGNALSTMAAGAAFYVWYAAMQGSPFFSALKTCGMNVREQLIWVKSSFTFGRQDYQWRHEPCLYGWKDGARHYFTDSRNESTVYDDTCDIDHMSKNELREMLHKLIDGDIATTAIRNQKPVASPEHPTMKPVLLFAYLMKNSSRPGDGVIDPFGGSGTTLIAAEQLGRTCYMMELDPHYCDVIIKRWENLTGEKAVLS